ncbi:Hypothetical predicted protein [Pelobates cultripes]|uniref:Uncharacterized protein n=1 Tax=Pelobates cultripes TaxID=61616 RepID=A0AAD1TIL9_PELCU|nr:Hypothetical predicted protein [Pelobates cultripes]
MNHIDVAQQTKLLRFAYNPSSQKCVIRAETTELREKLSLAKCLNTIKLADHLAEAQQPGTA